jgi:putative flippase GtrA
MNLTIEPRGTPVQADPVKPGARPAPLRSERQRILRYLIVGTIGFIVDAGLVAVQVHLLGIGSYVARGPSFLTAVTVTWHLNSTHTFKGLVRHPAGKAYRRYLLAQVIGATANLGVYAVAIASIPYCAKYPVTAVAIASGFGLIVNYTLARLFVFPGPTAIAEA